MVKIAVRLPDVSYKATAEIMSDADCYQIWLLDLIEVDDLDLAERVVSRYNLERHERSNPLSLASVLTLVKKERESMVFVVSQITNLDECGGSYSIAAKFRAKMVSASELQGMVTSEAIVVDTHEIAERVIAKFHCEREIKKSPISLASALELVQNEIGEERKKEQTQYEKGLDRITQLREQREEQIARLQTESEKERLDSALRERARLRLELLSRIMPSLMQQNFENFTNSGGAHGLTPAADVIKAGYKIVDEMIVQSGLDDI